MKLTIVLFIVALGAAMCQDDTFTKPITFEQPIYTVKIIFPDGTEMTSALGGGQIVSWDDIQDKPVTFPSSWDAIADKPSVFPPDMSAVATIELQEAISQLQGLLLPKMTQAQIDALAPQEGLIVYNLTSHILQYYNGSIWKILITAN